MGSSGINASTWGIIKIKKQLLIKLKV